GQIMILISPIISPAGWVPCEGQLLSIAQNQALFAIMGTYYGGNGTTNFALPDLRARVPMGVGDLVGGTLPPSTPEQIPLVTTLGVGQKASGQVGVLGLSHVIALQGV